MAYRPSRKKGSPSSTRRTSRSTSRSRVTRPKRRRVSRTSGSVKTVRLVIEAPSQPTGRLPITEAQIAQAKRGTGTIKRKFTF